MRTFFGICASLAMFAFACLGTQPAATNSEAKSDAAKPAQPYPVTAVVASNTVTFPILLSRNSEPLMTNAVFHRSFGRKVIFGEDLSVQAFDYEKLHPSVLAQLNLDPDKLKADQEALNQQYQLWASQFQKGIQQLLTSESATTTAAGGTGTEATSTNSSATNTPNHHWHYRYARASAGKSAPKTTRAHAN
jgi:hypothetical protein